MRMVGIILAASAVVAAAPGVAQDKTQGAVAPRHARNIILFLGDAGGVPTLNAAGIIAHDRPQSLFIQSMPHVGLSDTSALDNWVTDSAAGMSAIMTGHKTNNGMISALPAADGGITPVKSFLEYAEQRGLSTGVITNMPIWDATPAACFAHVATRKDKDQIFHQMLSPHFGNGVDILIGRGQADAAASFARDGTTPQQAFSKAGYRLGDDPALVREGGRVAVLRDADYAPMPAVEAAIGQLARNPKGYFLMVEWDMHTDKPENGLKHVIEMDEMIRRVSAIAGKDTLILFTADHSFGLRMTGGKRNVPMAQQYAATAAKPDATVASNAIIRVEDNHTGEEVIAAAAGPGADQVHGFFANTRLFDVMLQAMGWKKED
jgi:alkaline phosphatase